MQIELGPVTSVIERDVVLRMSNRHLNALRAALHRISGSPELQEMWSVVEGTCRFRRGVGLDAVPTRVRGSIVFESSVVPQGSAVGGEEHLTAEPQVHPSYINTENPF